MILSGSELIEGAVNTYEGIVASSIVNRIFVELDDEVARGSVSKVKSV